MDFLNTYFQIILEERFWSWSLVGILYIILGFMVRGWFLSPMVHRAKDLPPKYYQEVKHAYLRYSFWGWFFFFLPLVFFTLVWNWNEELPLSGRSLTLLVLGVLSYIGSLMLHLQAFGSGLAMVLKRLIEEREYRAAIKNP